MKEQEIRQQLAGKLREYRQRAGLTARKFLEKGDRVKVTLRFRGREMAHMTQSKYILDDFAKALEEVAVVEKAPKVEGRSLTMFLAQKRS